MKDHLLFYTYVPDILDRRGPHRDGHLAAAWAASARGELVMAGALTDPVDGAVFHFRGAERAAIEAFVANDPYVKAGLVTEWTIREWMTVAGEGALNPTGRPV
jgi:uncharacterized protein